MSGVDNPCPKQGSPPKRLRVGTYLQAKAGGKGCHKCPLEPCLHIIRPGSAPDGADCMNAVSNGSDALKEKRRSLFLEGACSSLSCT